MSSLSIKDRIRALAAADQADVVVATEAVPDDDQPDEPVAESIQQAPTAPKRSSVIDMWRKREESVTSPQKVPLPPRKSTGGVAALSPIGVNNTQIVAESSPSYKFEEKKEATRDEKPPLTVQTSVKNRWTNSAASPAKNKEVIKPNDFGHDVPESPAMSVSGDAERPEENGTPGSRTKVRSIWKQREATGASELPGASSFGSGTNGPGSQTPRGNVLDRWNKRAQAQDESDATPTPTVDVPEAPASIPPASPIVKASSGTPKSAAPSSPAFSDLKSKWAKFGVENVESRQEPNRPPSQPATPTMAASPKVVKSQEAPKPVPSKVKTEVPAPAPAPKEAVKKPAKEPETKDSKIEPAPVTTQSKAHQHATSVRRARQAMLKKEQLRKMGHGVGTKSTAAATSAQPPVEEEPGQIPVAAPEASAPTPASPARTAPNTPNAPSVGAKKAASYANSASPPRLSPRKFAQRKMLLDKHRQRSNPTSENEDDDNVEPQPVSEEPVSSDNAEISDTLSDAFQDVGTDAQREALSQNLANTRPVDVPSPQDPTTVSLNHLLAYGANESDFVENELGMPNQNGGNSEYSSLQVSDSFSKQDSTHLLSGSIINSVLSDGADGGASVEDQLSAIGSTVSARSKGSIVQRAQQSLREKRNKNRQLEEEQNDVEQESSENNEVENDQQPDGSVPNETAEGYDIEVTAPSNIALDSDAYPQDELMGSMPTHPAGNAPTSTSRRRQAPSSGAVDNTFDSESSTSNVISMDSSGYSNSESLSNSGMVLNGTGLAAHADSFLADKFVAESENNVEAFASSLKAMSIGQMARDLHQEVASSLTGVDFNRISTDLNEGMAAASDSLNKLVGAKVFSARVIPQRQPSPIEEEVAIEVEYVEDSESEDED